MRIANTVSDSIVDGPGLRFTVFTQGCSHACPGCHNPETHCVGGGQERTVEELANEMRSNPLLDGLTLSGGDPFLQPEECAALCRAAHTLGLNVWAYTGDLYEEILSRGNPQELALLDETDVLVDGPYLEQQKSYEALFRGSGNQRLIDVKASRELGQAVLWSWGAHLAHFTVPES